MPSSKGVNKVLFQILPTTGDHFDLTVTLPFQVYYVLALSKVLLLRTQIPHTHPN